MLFPWSLIAINKTQASQTKTEPYGERGSCLLVMPVEAADSSSYFRHVSSGCCLNTTIPAVATESNPDESCLSSWVTEWLCKPLSCMCTHTWSLYFCGYRSTCVQRPRMALGILTQVLFNYFFLFETGSLRGKEFAKSARLINWPESQSDWLAKGFTCLYLSKTMTTSTHHA